MPGAHPFSQCGPHTIGIRNTWRVLFKCIKPQALPLPVNQNVLAWDLRICVLTRFSSQCWGNLRYRFSNYPLSAQFSILAPLIVVARPAALASTGGSLEKQNLGSPLQTSWRRLHSNNPHWCTFKYKKYCSCSCFPNTYLNILIYF